MLVFELVRTMPIGESLGWSVGGEGGEVSRGGRLRAPFPFQNGLNPRPKQHATASPNPQASPFPPVRETRGECAT